MNKLLRKFPWWNASRKQCCTGGSFLMALIHEVGCSYLALKIQYNYALPQIVYLALPRKYYLALFLNQLVYLALPLFPLVDIALIG